MYVVMTIVYVRLIYVTTVWLDCWWLGRSRRYGNRHLSGILRGCVSHYFEVEGRHTPQGPLPKAAG
jgi:hypothetical protein